MTERFGSQSQLVIREQQRNARLREWIAGARSVRFAFPILLRLIVMPVDRIIHAYAEHYDFEWEEDVGKPIYPSSLEMLLQGPHCKATKHVFLTQPSSVHCLEH